MYTSTASRSRPWAWTRKDCPKHAFEYGDSTDSPARRERSTVYNGCSHRSQVEMEVRRAHGEPMKETQAAAEVLVDGLGSLLRAQLSVASGDVTKAAAVTEAVATELVCMRKDAISIKSYCQACENKISGVGGDTGLLDTLSAIDDCHEECMLLDEILGQMEGHMASLEERWGRLKR